MSLNSHRSHIAGAIISVIINGGVIAYCIIGNMTYVDKRVEDGILIDYSDFEPIPEPKEIETAIGVEPKSETPKPNDDVKLVQRAESPTEGERANESIESTVGDKGDVEVNEPPKPKPIEQRALFSSANNNKKDTIAQQVAQKVSNALDAGHGSGNTDIGNTDGAPSAQLKGRTTMGNLPTPSYNVQESGRVVVKIMVNRDGKVVSAVAGAPGTTTTSKILREAARKAALDAKFNVDNTAPVQQEGTITYIFKLK